MENRIFDEKNGLWYEKQGDYYFPCLTLSNEETKSVSIWGQRHARYLKENHKIVYMNLLTDGKLNNYLTDIDEQAEEMFLRLVKQIAECENITEALKAENAMFWVKKMNEIQARAREIVNEELIYTF